MLDGDDWYRAGSNRRSGFLEVDCERDGPISRGRGPDEAGPILSAGVPPASSIADDIKLARLLRPVLCPD